MSETESRVFVAGATGYLGGFLTAEFVRRGWEVVALSRSQTGGDRLAAIGATPAVAEATDPASLDGLFHGVEVVVSSLGITRQKDGVTYEEVDYQANVNMLRAAEAAGVQLFVYVSVFNGPELADTAMVGAKERFVQELTESPIRSLVVRPTGYFCDMEDIFAMAQKGRVWVFGNGEQALNPIHGQDLATVIVDAVQEGPAAWAEGALEVGGPQELTMRGIGEIAFEALGKEPRISSVPMWLVGPLERVLPRVTPQSVYGSIQFLLAASHLSMVAPAHGSHRLADHYSQLAADPS
jgi:uncharacterized protein YbjT (DUF2867 family)